MADAVEFTLFGTEMRPNLSFAAAGRHVRLGRRYKL